jgi:prophage regulatory protein
MTIDNDDDHEVLKPRDVFALTTLSRTTIWRLRRLGDFPPPLRLSPGRLVWRKKAVKRWLRDLRQVATAASAPPEVKGTHFGLLTSSGARGKPRTDRILGTVGGPPMARPIGMSAARKPALPRGRPGDAGLRWNSLRSQCTVRQLDSARPLPVRPPAEAGRARPDVVQGVHPPAANRSAEETLRGPTGNSMHSKCMGRSASTDPKLQG